MENCFESWVQTRVSNRTGQYNFLGKRDRSSFIVPGQAQNFAKRRDGLGQPDKIRDGTQDWTVQDFESVLSRGTKWDRVEKDVRKQEKDILKQKMTF